MIYEYLRPLLDNPRDVQRLHQLGERFARAGVPQQIVDAVRMGRITPLREPDGGVRGIVAVDLPPFNTPSPRVLDANVSLTWFKGCEMNPTATITSIDGISAYDSISRRAMLQGFHHLDKREGGE